jgi:hypothetical protein
VMKYLEVFIQNSLSSSRSNALCHWPGQSVTLLIYAGRVLSLCLTSPSADWNVRYNPVLLKPCLSSLFQTSMQPRGFYQFRLISSTLRIKTQPTHACWY